MMIDFKQLLIRYHGILFTRHLTYSISVNLSKIGLKHFIMISIHVCYKMDSLKYFEPQRGYRQGDPISPYLFLLCAEILGILIRNNKDIKGITIDGKEYTISQYADDTSLVTNGSPESLNGILIELDMFASISGLRINFTKTKMV